jgi:D-sedoheptulose 7-phosphate isomerase
MPVAIDFEAAVRRKSRESQSTLELFFSENGPRIVACAAAMARAFSEGGRLFAMGNGGSACDARHAAVEFMHPIVEKRPAFPAVALGSDTALLSAVANDSDFALAFSSELKLLARRGDVALGISTSGKSAGVLRALQAAKELGLLAVGLTGRDGGRFPDICDHCFVVPSFSIHRIQEVHATFLHVLWDLVHMTRGEEDVL